MRKIGFTLAEVLVTLGIVGVIAAITLPTLHLNVERQKVGPAFMKAINTLESSATYAVRINEVRGLSDINKKLFDILINYAQITELDGEFVSKDGIVFSDGKYSNSLGAYKVIIDINGGKERKPNKWGIDKFSVYVLNDGSVIIPGTRLYQERINPDMKLWPEGCPTVEFGEPGVKPPSADTCAGSIVENGGRVTYSYDLIQ